MIWILLIPTAALAILLGISFAVITVIEWEKLDNISNTTDDEINALRSYVDSLESSVTALRATIEALEQKNGTYPWILAKLASLNESQITTETRLEDATKQLSSSIEALNYSLNAAIASIVILKQSNGEILAKFTSLNESQISTEARLEDATKQLSSSIEALNYSLIASDRELRNKTSELTTDIQQTTQQLQNSIAGVEDDLQSTANELKSSINTTAANLTKLQASTDATATQFRSEIGQIVHEIDQIDHEIYEIQRKLVSNLAAATHAMPVLTISVVLLSFYILY